MKILALDLATRTGWASSAGASGTFELQVKKDESSGMRLIRFRGKLEEIRTSVGVELVVFETALQMPKQRAGFAVQAEMQGVLKLWCQDHGIDYRTYSPSQIKKFATGNGNANKEKMVDAAERRFGRIFADDAHNETDALWLLELARADLRV